ncbi:hypothetical protein KDA00_03480 [Candidatus Saccharibacteria bacterium]|nr:hypothetical protein [Candidatus Saccharibacteria bacterium]
MDDNNNQNGQTPTNHDDNPYAQLANNDSGTQDQTAPSDNNNSDMGVSAPPVDNSSDFGSNNSPAQDNNSTQAVDDLLSIKQDALKQLNPLVSHLDQNPEEKFRTTLMMIQASDDQSLIKTAYEAAKQITDEKAKAQALLDIVNEINYFTQQNK